MIQASADARSDFMETLNACDAVVHALQTGGRDDFITDPGNLRLEVYENQPFLIVMDIDVVRSDVRIAEMERVVVPALRDESVTATQFRDKNRFGWLLKTVEGFDEDDETETEIAEDEDEIDFDSMTKKQLIEFIKFNDLPISGASEKLKDDLLNEVKMVWKQFDF